MWLLPVLMMLIASFRCTLRLVGSAPPYSTLRLKKPFAPIGMPTFAATAYDGPFSPANVYWPPNPLLEPGFESWNCPERTSMLPPELASLSWKLITPAIASEPYWADAPSRRTSTCRSAMAGMTEMSGPWEPSEIPFPSQAMTAARCRRLPLTRIRV